MYKITVRRNKDILIVSTIHKDRELFTGKDSSKKLRDWISHKNYEGHQDCEHCNQPNAKLSIHPIKYIETGNTIDWICNSCYLDAILETDLIKEG